MPSSFPTGINSMKLKVSTYEQDFSSASLGNNVIQITEQNIINVLESPGVNTIPSIVAAYSNVATYSNSAISSGSINIEIAGTPYINPPRWVQRGANIDGEEEYEDSGWSVSLSSDGSIVAIGAPYYQGGGYQRGHVRVYARNGTTWVQRGANINGEAANDISGWSVSLSADGSIVAIGAPNNAGGGYQRGHVRVYAWNGTTWVQRGANINGEAYHNQSGFSVSLSADGSIVATGAHYNAGDGGSYRGHVRVYAWNGTIWVQRGADIDGETDYDQSGENVSLSADGSTVAIGAPNNAGDGGSSRGHVRVYAWNGTTSTWVQRGADIDGEADSDQSGWSVSLSSDGSIVAIGAPNNAGDGGSSRGHVRVYEWKGTIWVQRGADIDGAADSDQTGWSVSLSSDGSIVAIGAPGSRGSRGRVRVYEWNGTTWVQRGANIDGEANNDRSGQSVSLSTDGSIVAISAPYNAGGGSGRGRVRLLEYS